GPPRARAVGIGLAEREIELASAAPHQRLFAGGGPTRREAALRWLHDADRLAVARHDKRPDQLAIIRALAVGESVEMQVVVTERDRLAGLDLRDAFGAELRLADDAEESDAEPKMGERGAPGRTREAAGARESDPWRHLQQGGAFDQIGHRAGDDEGGEAKGERHQDRTAALGRESHRNGDHGERRRAEKALRNTEQVAALPGEQRPERRRHQERQEQQPEYQIEERRADRNLLAGHRVERERVERAVEHG